MLASFVPSASVMALAAAHCLLASGLALQTFVSWLQMALVMMPGLRASPWPLLTSGSVGKKVPSVAFLISLYVSKTGK